MKTHKKYMKIRSNLDDELPLNKMIEVPSIIIVIRAVFHENSKYYPQFCHYWHFLNHGFKFQPNVCNRCHDLLMMSINLSDIASDIVLLA